jgi:hypothetical protein
MRSRPSPPAELLPAAAILVLLVAGGLRAGALAADRATPFAVASVGEPDRRVRQEPFRWRGRVPAGGIVEVRGLSGFIRASLASGDQAEVSAVKRGAPRDTAAVQIQVVEHAGGVTICAIYPTRDGRMGTCRPGGPDADEMQNGDVRNSDVQVDFTVQVPRGVSFVGRTVQGDVTARGLAGPVHASSVNGSIELSTSGSGDAETVNGSVTAVLGSTDGGPLSLRTVNGSVELTLPAGAGANIEAETMNGEISTDVPLDGVTRMGKNHVEGTLGGGGPEVELETMNGDIDLRSGSSSP